MINTLAREFRASEDFVGDYSEEAVEPQQTLPKTSPRQESVAPKIVVCPPMEEGSDSAVTSRGVLILKVIGKRISKRATDANSLGSSSSDDSMSSETNRTDERSSRSGSDSGSDGSERTRRHRSTVTLRRMFQSLSLKNRSQSSSPIDRQRQPKKQQQPKRILRPPVTYTYVRGLSGLPTQRVPRLAVNCTSSGLNR